MNQNVKKITEKMIDTEIRKGEPAYTRVWVSEEK